MENSFQANKGMGLTDNDLDDVRRLISDTSVYLLGVTIFASTLHLLFEFLAFQSDITFWQQNTSLAGLSVRALITDLISQIIIFLFLLESNSSLLVTIPSFIAILIQIWKAKKATGFEIKGFKILFTRLQKPSGAEDSGVDAEENYELARVTLEADRYATTHLGALIFPLIVGFAIRTLVMDKHASWYSWIITTLTSSVYVFLFYYFNLFHRYAGGFVLMCPQLFINHKLKSVAHLPWKFLCFRFVNTFIDGLSFQICSSIYLDLFAFIIRMPTMHRLSVFRDDFVFLVYMYQRYIYRVDMSRPMEK
jgi:hypothetical protein